MSSWPLTAPSESDYAPYYGTYVSKVPSGNVLDILEREMADTTALLGGIGEDHAGYRYADGKWSIKEVVGHVLDAERVFAMRCLAFARSDVGPWLGMEQDPWVEAANFDRHPLADLTLQLGDCRRANLSLFRSLSDEEMSRRGVASGVEFAARAFPYIIAGHEIHHKQVVRERYLQTP